MKGMEVHITQLTETNEEYARGNSGRSKDRDGWNESESSNEVSG